MNPQKTVTQFYSAIEHKNIDKLEGLLAPDFTFEHGAAPGPMDRATFIAMIEAVVTGIPNWDFHAEVGHHTPGKKANKVTSNVQITGKQTGALKLSDFGLPDVPPTKKSFSLPPETGNFWLNEKGQIARHQVPAVPGGGLPGVLNLLGVKVKAPAQ